ncbi:MAG: preprotein translocase subunit YajC [Candidatus Omnitrophica bacterium]|nr:preprotein translocase subunit YajC [Candidatus Omnitrophota bacterium]
MWHSSAYAQEVSVQGNASQQNPIMGFLPIILIFTIFYFLLIRPQKKAQDEHTKMVAELKKNDEIITSGGIYGTIVNIQDDTVTIRVDDNTRIKILRSAVSKIIKAKAVSE